MGAGKACVIPEWPLDQHHPQNTKDRGPPRPHPGPPVLTSQAPTSVLKGIPRAGLPLGSAIPSPIGQREPLQEWLIVAGEAPRGRRGIPLGRERARSTSVRDRSTSGSSWELPGSPAAPPSLLRGRSLLSCLHPFPTQTNKGHSARTCFVDAGPCAQQHHMVWCP